MTPRRDDLHELFKELTPNVYFQAPSNTVMKYPCIRYEIDDAEQQFAGNRPYLHTWRYQVMVIDPDPDSPIREALKGWPMIRFERHYVADDLHHFVFNVFF
jgi:hypothetical protein